MTLEEAEAAVKDMLAGNAFGDAGHRIVIEEFLDGEEASFIVMVDGEHVLHDGHQPGSTSASATADAGPNTGGMGAYSRRRWLLMKSTSAPWSGLSGQP